MSSVDFDLLARYLFERCPDGELDKLHLEVGQLAVDLRRDEFDHLFPRDFFLGVEHVQAEFLHVDEGAQAREGRFPV